MYLSTTLNSGSLIPPHISPSPTHSCVTLLLQLLVLVVDHSFLLWIPPCIIGCCHPSIIYINIMMASSSALSRGMYCLLNKSPCASIYLYNSCFGGKSYWISYYHITLSYLNTSISYSLFPCTLQDHHTCANYLASLTQPNVLLQGL